MIRRSRLGIQIPESLQSAACRASLLSIIDNITSDDSTRIKAGKKAIASDFYRGKTDNGDGTFTQDVAVALGDLYEHKCAFCESKRFKPDVEHFRPKKNVTGIVGHIGYYWLCYEWTNLIPTCSDCNDIKHTSFPISNEAKRIYGPSFLFNREIDSDANSFENSTLLDETPMLFHPEFDLLIETSFAFTNKGEIKGIDPDGKGEITQEKCGLNRDDLIYFRLQVIHEYRDYLEMALVTNNDDSFIQILLKLRNRALNTD